MRFFYCTDEMRSFWNEYGIYFSKKFCEYFSNNVKEILYREAGLKPSTKVSLSTFKPYDLAGPMYEQGPISKIHTALSILPEFTDPIDFCWKSRSGKIIRTDDEDFDEGDLECWIEGLKPSLYWEEVHEAAIDHPFKIKNLSYRLIVNGVGTPMTLHIELTDTVAAQEIIDTLYGEVESYNRKSEEKRRANGVVHNCNGGLVPTGIEFTIDIGSAGISFVKTILKKLNEYPITSVTIDL